VWVAEIKNIMNASIKTTRFTPRHYLTNVRAEMEIAEQDYECFSVLKKNQWGSFHDYVSGKNYSVRKASCPTPGCMCDAVYKEV
jgi:hypothetical protein